ncbi:hypothetical protein [Leifsonia sp. fls2-241-R2A-40a]|uniref:hypothetical protein n=1 Tax=Leifsonia sp. fls2-241-R2A-40a TaxID=3040290 RepID=UPI0025504AB7|nr:hypothetical protein [Leifsonia sp. fls2-241-R2A-40a]
MFSTTYDEVTSPAQRAALTDGKISDQEYAYFRQQIVSCLAGIGVEASWKDGSVLDYSQPPSVSNDDIGRCNKSGGLDVIALRDAILRNPDNKDESEILVACLKRVHAVAPSYTADMLDSGTDLDRFINTDKFAKCNEDPLGYGVK